MNTGCVWTRDIKVNMFSNMSVTDQVSEAADAAALAPICNRCIYPGVKGAHWF